MKNIILITLFALLFGCKKEELQIPPIVQPPPPTITTTSYFTYREEDYDTSGQLLSVFDFTHSDIYPDVYINIDNGAIINATIHDVDTIFCADWDSLLPATYILNGDSLQFEFTVGHIRFKEFLIRSNTVFNCE